MFPDRIRLYPLTDVARSGLSHAEQITRLAEGGARLVQLREKHLSPKEFYKQAEAAVLVARKLGVTIIINDRVDFALALAADGVHLGQNDLPPEAARRVLGPKAIIGYSTHTREQALAAADSPVDYIAFGPIFATSSKENPDAAVGLAGLRQVRKALGAVKLVAIGGINHENAPEVILTGADAVAVISTLLSPPGEITSQTQQLLRALENL